MSLLSVLEVEGVSWSVKSSKTITIYVFKLSVVVGWFCPVFSACYNYTDDNILYIYIKICIFDHVFTRIIIFFLCVCNFDLSFVWSDQECFILIYMILNIFYINVTLLKKQLLWLILFIKTMIISHVCTVTGLPNNWDTQMPVIGFSNKVTWLIYFTWFDCNNLGIQYL